MKRMPKVRLSFLLLLLLGCGLVSCTLNNTPRRSLAEFRTALVNHDADKALQYIDVDSIVEHMVKDLFVEYEARAKDPLTSLGLKAGREVADFAMPAMRSLARRQVRAAIVSDDQWGYFKDIRRASVWYLNIEEDGDTAMVAPKGKSDISFKMARKDPGRWQIVQIIRKKST